MSKGCLKEILFLYVAYLALVYRNFFMNLWIALIRLLFYGSLHLCVLNPDQTFGKDSYISTRDLVTGYVAQYPKLCTLCISLLCSGASLL